MRSIFWYLKNNKNKTFDELPFNEIDSLILCQISYMNLDKFVYDEFVLFNDLFILENIDRLVYKTVLSKKNRKLAKALIGNIRYKDIRLNHCRAISCHEEIKQFFSVSYFINDYIYVAYRGTDYSFYAWHEDFMMAYIKEIPSQKEAINYLSYIYEKYKMKMIVGGHSKGGNLALYSSIYSSEELSDNIIRIYNYDGPGFNNPDIYLNNNYLKLKDRIISLSVKFSVVGLMLHHEEGLEFLQSSSLGLLSHDAYSWSVLNNEFFKRVETNSLGSKIISKALKIYILESNNEDIKRFIEILFILAKENPNSSVLDLYNMPINYLIGVFKRLKKLDSDDSSFYKGELLKIMRIINKVRKEKLYL